MDSLSVDELVVAPGTVVGSFEGSLCFADGVLLFPLVLRTIGSFFGVLKPRTRRLCIDFEWGFA